MDTSKVEFLTFSKASAGVKPSSDVDSIIDSILSMYELNSTAFGLMGLRARSLVKSEFAWDKIKEDLMTLYLWVSHGCKKPEFMM